MISVIPEPRKITYKEGVCSYHPNMTVYEKRDDIPSEGYVLNIESNSVTISFSDGAGKFYAEKTLEQLLFTCGKVLPLVIIEDFPRFKFRSYMLDVSRYFFTVEEIKKQIDYLSLYKINTLHLHLTDDQGWRIEIKKYPKLTEIGSYRNRTVFRFQPHCGFYTQEELKDIVAYAEKRFIQVIPEIDIPGHFSAAIAAYPELGCFGEGAKVSTNFGIKFDVACLGKPETVQFIKDVLGEVADIFPCKYFHIGGDEVPDELWKLCKHCTSELYRLKLDNFNEFQAHFTNVFARFLQEKGKTVIMWNESELTGMVDNSIVWEYWGGGLPVKEMIKEINNGRTVINAYSERYYLDIPYCINTVKSAYEYDAAFPEADKPSVLGVELPLWSELIPSQRQAEIMTFPRLIAVAETAWSGVGDYKAFLKKYNFHAKYLKGIGLTLPSKHKYNPSIVRRIASGMWWERRQMYWGGLQNLIRIRKITKYAKKMNK